MVRDIKKLFESKNFVSKDEKVILEVIDAKVTGLSLKNITLNKGVLSFKNIPSALRLTILLNKKYIINQVKKRDIYLRDIM